jgi:hypothetical protein
MLLLLLLQRMNVAMPFSMPKVINGYKLDPL